MEVGYVDRDVVTKTWRQKSRFNSPSSVIYAGPHSGDMIEWRIPGNPLGGRNMSWEARHLDTGEVVSGPSGVGVNFWRIADDQGNDPLDDKWLDWKPGTYAIFCEMFGRRLEVHRLEIGYRSDHVLVIGQIVPTFSHDVDKPGQADVAPWAHAIADDVTNTALSPDIPNYNEIYDDAVLAKKSFCERFPEKGAQAWAGAWAGALGLPPHFGVPPATPPAFPPESVGPAMTSFRGINGPVGNMTSRHHYWATQHMLNTNSDIPQVPAEIYVKRRQAPSVESALSHILQSRQYRILHNFQAKFLIDETGRINKDTFEALHNRAVQGDTKLRIGEVNAGNWGQTVSPIGITLPPVVVPLPPFDIKPFPDEPSETNRHNKKISHDSAGKEVSSFATARIGENGRRVSYRQFGKDAPWIFSEIIFRVDDERRVKLLGRTSTTVQWSLEVRPDRTEEVRVERSPFAPASTPGISIFNNLNIYSRSEIDRFVRFNNGLLRM